MARSGLNRGTSGNISARLGEGMLVTASGVVPEALTPSSMVYVGPAGERREGELKPSSEWRMHQGLLRRRPDMTAVVHCHARYCTILACLGRPIPPIHYMVGVSGASSVPVAPYARFGSEALAEGVAAAMGQGGRACLMANHGLVALGVGLRMALAIAEEIEEQAAVYWGALAIGQPNQLTDRQMDEVFAGFRGYGQAK